MNHRCISFKKSQETLLIILLSFNWTHRKCSKSFGEKSFISHHNPVPNHEKIKSNEEAEDTSNVGNQWWKRECLQLSLHFNWIAGVDWHQHFSSFRHVQWKYYWGLSLLNSCFIISNLISCLNTYKFILHEGARWNAFCVPNEFLPGSIWIDFIFLFSIFCKRSPIVTYWELLHTKHSPRRLTPSTSNDIFV